MSSAGKKLAWSNVLFTMSPFSLVKETYSTNNSNFLLTFKIVSQLILFFF